MEISNAMSICFKNKIKVYPIKTVVGWKIQVVINNKKTTYDKVLLNKKEINVAIYKSYLYLAEKYG